MARDIDESLLVEAMDALVKSGGSQALAARIIGIPRQTFMGRVAQARRRGIVASSGRHVEPNKSKDFYSLLPKAIDVSEKAHHLSGERSILIVGDIHVPYHDEHAVEAALEFGLKSKADTVILNGDIVDCAAVSRHEKTPAQRMGLEGELSKTRELLTAIRAAFPKAEIIYNEGNHEYRLPSYISAHAPELWTLEQLQLPSLLRLSEHKIKWLSSNQTLTAGDLYIIHGHEYRMGGIHIARTTLLASGANTIQNHHHRVQEHIQRNISGSVKGSWTVGCLCQTNQPWLPFNQWVQGCALVELETSGSFYVRNMKYIHRKWY